VRGCAGTVLMGMTNANKVLFGAAHQPPVFIGTERWTLIMTTESKANDGTIQELFLNALKNNPNRLIVGEIKGVESKDILESALIERGGMVVSVMGFLDEFPSAS